jgi:hypothetical protein
MTKVIGVAAIFAVAFSAAAVAQVALPTDTLGSVTNQSVTLDAAGPPVTTPPGYDNNPGRQRAGEVGAQCDSGAGSGAFGAFTGKGNNFAGGADGRATGENNSAICGNRQGQPPPK